ncbi:hypothetical protein P22_3126 [Propionispora sp. 2/2-37]|uniref:PTS fructose transporter subunit IIB n=1 Tax=Propionispora sp. 2/2-37 TaxID=1677858 RepID=UPI0006BB7337|nr:PTS fructose transporter subunit IIB [Propionispora sp. 2/2-37]CUH97000.1 hypothetical protein P22_3126 [Propionispora sp. 2/2-37]
MRPIKILSVCGSGTVSSAMVSGKLKERLGEAGYEIVTVEVNPGGVESALLSGTYDFIAHTSPISGEFDIPVINAVGFLTGFGEEEFLEEALKVIKAIEA